LAAPGALYFQALLADLWVKNAGILILWFEPGLRICGPSPSSG
jgi:hypothetical protein